MHDIVVVGSCNVDLTSYVTDMPAPGETIAGSLFNMSFGGKGANQAVMCKLLSAHVAFVSKVGSDYFGQAYLENLNKIKLNTEFIKREEGVSTGTAVIIVTSSGENSIIITPGANSHINQAYVESILPNILPKSRVLLVQMEIDPHATLAALKMAHSMNVITILNPSPAKEVSKDFLKYCSILCCNEIELKQLTGIKTSDSYEDIETGCRCLIDAGCQYVIVTLGQRGAVFMDHVNLQGKSIPIPIKVDKVVDTTGAGDAFLGSLAYLISKSESKDIVTSKIIEKSLGIATLSVTQVGAQPSYQGVLEQVRSHGFDS